VNATSGALPANYLSGDDTKAARQYQAELVSAGIVRFPFDLSVVDLVPTSVAHQITQMRQGSNSDLNIRPANVLEARGALCSYLKGTCEYRQEDIEERVKESHEYRQLNVADFRTKAALQLRDAALRSEAVNFLWQAFRFRGKANYRDAMYLSYGNDNTPALRDLNADLATSANAFAKMAAHYTSRRTEAGTWTAFVDDVVASARFTVRFTVPFDVRAI
jgi:hypothetical protein